MEKLTAEEMITQLRSIGVENPTGKLQECVNRMATQKISFEKKKFNLDCVYDGNGGLIPWTPKNRSKNINHYLYTLMEK